MLCPGATIGGTTTGAGNTISDNSGDGIHVLAGATATITNDLITGDGTGILVGNGAFDACLVTAKDDNLSGNTIAGITNNQMNPAYAVTASDDWWGSLHGPTTTANPGGNGSSVSSNVSFSPWIGVYTPGTRPRVPADGHHPLLRPDDLYRRLNRGRQLGDGNVGHAGVRLDLPRSQRQHQPGRQRDRLRPVGLLLAADDHPEHTIGTLRDGRAGSDRWSWGRACDD